jgi:hypothetical protein
MMWLFPIDQQRFIDTFLKEDIHRHFFTWSMTELHVRGDVEEVGQGLSEIKGKSSMFSVRQGDHQLFCNS